MPNSVSDKVPSANLPAPKVVFMSAMSTMGSIYFEVMTRLRRHHQTRFIVMAESATYKTAYTRYMGPEDRLFDPALDLAEALKTAPSADTIKREARHNERQFGIHYMRDIVQSDRRLVTRFNPSTLGSVHASHKVEDLGTINQKINFYFRTYEQLFRDEAVDLALIRPDSLECSVAAHVARKRGIPVTFLAAANYKSYLTWYCGPYMSGARFKENMERVTDLEEQAFWDEGDLIPEHAANDLIKAGSLATLASLQRNLVMLTIDRLHFIAKDLLGRRKSHRLSYATLVGYYFRQFRTARKLINMSIKSVDEIKARPYILYLLQVEPEYSTLCLSREFSFVEAIIYQLALCTPAGYRLVVKEHTPNIGNRPVEFFDRISRIPNVAIADFRINGLELARHAAAISTISGSIGKQATRMGKPVIVFSNHVDYIHMDNIRVVKSFHDLPAIVEWAVRERTEDELAAWKKAGNRFYASVVKHSFDAPMSRIFSASGGGIFEGRGESGVGDIATRQLIEMFDWLRRNGTVD